MKPKYKSTEKNIRKYVRDKLKSHGCIYTSVNAKFHPNWPDTQVFTPTGESYFIEFKERFIKANHKITNGQRLHAQNLYEIYNQKVYFISGERLIFSEFTREIPRELQSLVANDGFEVIHELPK